MRAQSQTSPEDELMRLAVSARAHRLAARDRVRDLAERVDWPRLADRLARQRLLELAGARLGELAPRSIPEDFAVVARATTEATARRGDHGRMTTLMVVDALARERIRSLPLKGPLLAMRLYGDAALRPSDDVDVLVSAADLERAARPLASLGYVRAGGWPRARRPLLHDSYVHGDGVLPTVELHWRVHWYEERFAAEMLSAAAPAADGALRAAPVHELAALLLFYARDGFAGLRLAADVAQFGDVRMREVPPGALADLGARHPALERALAVAAGQARRIVGAEVALDWRPAALGRMPAPARLGDWTLSSDDDQIRANATLVDFLLAPRSPAAFVRRQLLPPAPALRERGIVAADAPALAIARARVLHAARLVSRYAIAAWRIRGGRDWTSLPRAR